MKTKALVFLALVTALVNVPFIFAAENATLELASDQTTYNVGDEFEVRVLLDTAGVEVDEVDVKITYDPEMLVVVDGIKDLEDVQISEDEPLLEVFVQNTVDIENGEIFFEQASLAREQYYKTADEAGVVATITMRALKSGATTMSFDMETGNNSTDSSVLDSETGEDVLGEVINLDVTLSGEETVTEETTTEEESTEPELTNLNLNSDKNSMQVGSGDQATITVTAYDQDRNPMSDVALEYSVTSGEASMQSGLTNNDGVATFTVTPGEEAGSMQVKVVSADDASIQAVQNIAIEAMEEEVAPVEQGGPEENVSSGPDTLQDVGPGMWLAYLALGITTLLYGLRKAYQNR
jgi:hypothetical protein